MQQHHESLHAGPDLRVAVMVDLGELDGRAGLSKLKRGQILVRPSTSGTRHVVLLLLVIKAWCKQIRIMLLIEGTCHYT